MKTFDLPKFARKARIASEFPGTLANFCLSKNTYSKTASGSGSSSLRARKADGGMPWIQKKFRLKLEADAGVSKTDKKIAEIELNRGDEIRHVPDSKLLADLLKRQARRVMGDITECPPNTIAAHMARLDDLLEILRWMVNHDYAETAEASVSEAQLQYPQTLSDFIACLVITKKQNRAPVWVNSRDKEIAEIKDKLDQLAGYLSQFKGGNL